ncbi:MAG: hypothetical protein DMF56_20780 [Acidobacteria bacterium]|nr:MAG: hypothetical protein DMF56_20780 [Acidobacteriota bacterium]
MGDFDPLRALNVLTKHSVRFIVVGGVAARTLGSPSVTNDLDICYERRPENYEVLVGALRELDAQLRGAPPGLPFQLDARSIKMGDCFTFTTLAGDLDCLGTPAGTHGYPDLVKNATEEDLGEGVHVLITSIDDLLRMKRAAGRPKDLIEVEILSAVKEERERKS